MLLNTDDVGTSPDNNARIIYTQMHQQGSELQTQNHDEMYDNYHGFLNVAGEDSFENL